MKRLACLCLAALALASFGCGQSVDQNPKFQEKMALIDRVSEDLNATNGRLTQMDFELQTVSKDVQKIKQSPGGGGDAAAALEARVVALENSLKTANGMIVALEKRLSESGKRPVTTASSAARPAAPAVAAPAKTSAGEPAAKPATEKKSRNVRVVAHSSSRSESARTAVRETSAPRGGYYQVQPGETAESIATKHSIKPDALMAANRLPKDALLLAGQQIYVPAR
ncbi:MAG: LysM peptidoglycan-binding domain-containing protein [bacterium]|nr:LysM peptidoglycan-binding domain-containing protein [bacterium]